VFLTEQLDHDQWGSNSRLVDPPKVPEPTSRHYRRRKAKLARLKPKLDKITQARLKKLLTRLV